MQIEGANPLGPGLSDAQITNEAPVGIKAGLRASYQTVTQVPAPLYLISPCFPPDPRP